ncbi:hypothetical protein BDZ89DRAFT_1008576 [Hymenopellis radicata]|nr:hypothetical protein BDZ89DRAFT_1008576 [Hymenopellis radicata]
MSEREIRITSSGKMKTWISHALDCLKKDETKPIVFHTLPNPPPTKPGSKAVSPTNSTMLVPRLVSVVEIIKREYIKTLELSHSTRLLGLHQYNQVGSLEELGLAPVVDETIDEGEQRAENLIKALEGKNIKHVQTPYMKITLSLVELPELKDKGATYQPPLKRKMSKSAKARAKKREKKADGSAGGPSAAGS